MLEHLVADREPAEPVADLRHAGAAPERLVVCPHASHDALALRGLDALDDRRLQVVGDHRLDRLRAPRDDPLARQLDAADQVVERLDELVDPLLEQRLRHVAHVDPGLGEAVEVGRRVLVRRGAAHLELLGAGEQGRHRHRVHGVGGHERVHVLGLGVARVLHAGGRPQRALDRRAGLEQRGVALAAEQLLEAHVRRARVRDGGDPAEVLLAEVREPLVDLRVHARDEEARHRMHVERLAGLVAALHPADVGLGDRRVRLHREQERHVHVDAGRDRVLDRGNARLRAGDLDQEVRPVDPLPVLARLLDGRLGVVREVRLHLQRDEPVGVVRLLPERAQHVAGELHVEDRDLVVDVARRHALLGELRDLLVVVGRAEDRLLEDRGVGGDPAQRQLVHEALKLPGRDEAAADLVQPRARTRRGQSREPLVDFCSDAHLVPFSGAGGNALHHGSCSLGDLLRREAEVLVEVGLGCGLTERGHSDCLPILSHPRAPAKG